MKDRLGIGIVGGGFVARFHIRSFEAVRNADVLGIVSRTRETADDAAALARELGVGDAKGYDSVADMVADPAIDAIWICSPNFTRIDVMEEIVDTLASGKGELVGVCCEKPLGRNAAEAYRMAELVKQAGLLDGYLENQLFTPGVVRGKKFPVLRAGAGYELQVSMPGFMEARVTGQRVNVGTVARIEVRLTRNITEVVEVVGREDLVAIGQTGGSAKFEETFIDDLPIPGRFYQNLLSLAPGVLDADGDGNPNVHGGRERDFRATVGGVSNVDPLTGEWMSRVNSESIEVLEVLPWGAGVEHGRASAGFARVLQKQGSNQFEGVLSLLYSSSRLDGPGSENIGGTPEPEFQSFQPAFQISGPIARDRAWFRVSLERIQREDPVVALGPVIVSERNQEMNATQLTWQASPRNKLAFQFQNDPLTVTNQGVSSRVPAESAQTFERGGNTYSLTWTAPYSPKLLFDSQVAYQDHGVQRTPQSAIGDNHNGCAVFDDSFVDFGILDGVSCLNVATGLFGGPSPVTLDDRRQRLTVRGQATLYVPRFAGSSHQLKAGMIVENERYFRNLTEDPSIVFTSESVLPFWTGYTHDGIGNTQVRVAAPPKSSSRATGVTAGFYIEDQFKPSESLSVTLGLRYDREEIDSAGNANLDPAAEAAAYRATIARGIWGHRAAAESFTGFPDIPGFVSDLAEALRTSPTNIPLGPGAVASAFWEQDRRTENVAIRNNNFSPRVAIAWDPWADGKTRFSFSAGRYYDKIFLAIPLLDLEPSGDDAGVPFGSLPP